MDFTAARQAEILSAISNVSALVSDSTPHDSLLEQLATVTAERDTALQQVATLTAERDAALAEKAALQSRLDSIVADIQALSAADAQEDAAREAILAKAQGV